ncbi:MAG: flavodoxin family protein [Actinomycetota bacterium]|nr:flavodoxin family protein [Actinomycetota bacterium]
MKTIVINASPRKNFNTAQLLKEAQRGAESAGAETEYVDLYDLTFTGCRSCLACKANGMERCKCYWKDDLSPLVDRILAADAVIIGSPIYFGQPTAGFRALWERLAFPVLSYDGEPMSYYEGSLNVGFIWTMNATGEYYEKGIKPTLAVTEGTAPLFFHGKTSSYAALDTLQVKDYSKYAMGAFDAEAKQARHDEQFPADLEACFAMGAELSDGAGR